MNIKALLLTAFSILTITVESQNMKNCYFISNDGFSALRISNDTLILFVPNYGRIGHNVIKGIISDSIVNTVVFTEVVQSHARVLNRDNMIHGKSKIIIRNLYSGLDSKRENADIVKNKYILSVVLFNKDDRIIKSFSTTEMKIENGHLTYEIPDTLFKKAKISIGHDRSCQFASLSIGQKEIVEADFFIYPAFTYSNLKQFSFQYSNDEVILKIPYRIEQRNRLWCKSEQTKIREIRFQRISDLNRLYPLTVYDFNYYLNLK